MSVVFAPIDVATMVQEDSDQEYVASEAIVSARRRLVQYSAHALRRAAQRHLVPEAVDYVVAHGTCCHRTGIMFFFLGRRDVPPEDAGEEWAQRLVGTVVLASRDGEVITTYRNSRALRTILRKAKYRLVSHEDTLSAVAEPAAIW